MWLTDCFGKINWKKVGIFMSGFAFGTAGLKILASKDAKKAYVQATAAALRAKECVLDTAACIQENAEDVLAAAKEENEKRAAEVITDEDLAEDTESEDEA
ncbi:DUF6110 family protein [Oribacterium sp. NK2B42]|uniref:DUF6110 family protein n=1 Tax=Oribacterium sp. NK2B42 TaxID=689781 RepID=UPI00040DD46D|nr:DUF6110 family protein [Oribacterium sp. NK2B42]